MRFVNIPIVVNGDMSGNITSSVVPMDTEYAISFQAVYTGSPTSGILKIQVSDDNATWDDYTGSSQTITASGHFSWDVTETAMRYYRMVYVFTSGTGVLNIKALAKGD